MPEGKTNGLVIRVVSALILLPLAVGAIYAGGKAYLAMVLVASVLMVREWNVLCGGRASSYSSLAGTAGVVAAALVAAYDSVAYAAVLVAAGAVMAWVAGRWSGIKGPWAAVGALYTGIPIVALLWLRGDGEAGRWLTLFLFASVWATDIGAYAAGRTIGGARLAPRISPNKTWAGLLGGMLFAGLAGAAVAVPAGLMPVWAALAVAAAAALLAQVGDLGESMVKRHFHVKDSGSLIPGHGGILDRVDGLILTAPVLAVVVALLGRNWGGAQ